MGEVQDDTWRRWANDILVLHCSGEDPRRGGAVGKYSGLELRALDSVTNVATVSAMCPTRGPPGDASERAGKSIAFVAAAGKGCGPPAFFFYARWSIFSAKVSPLDRK